MMISIAFSPGVLYSLPMKLVRRTLVLFVLFVSAASVFAQSDKPLSDREVAKFADDWPAVVKWFQDKGKSLESASASRLVSAYLVGADYAAFIRGRGWTEDRFSYAAGTIFSLLAYIAFEKQNPDMIKQFDEALAQIKANTEMPLAEKAEAIRGLEEAKKAVLALPSEAKINEAELRLVRAHYDRLLKASEAGR